eukprot:g849.t1
MALSDVLAPGNVAVITGASSGIGHALACHCASLGMSVVLVDIEGLETACPAVQARVPEGSSAKIVGQVTDVSSRESVEAMRQAVCGAFDTVHFLVANAGIGNGAGALEAPEQWDKTIGVNMWGVINMCQAIAPVMAEKGQPGMVVCTGSKQGITAPPGNLAYNVSKAAVKTFTEGLAHDLRNRAGCRTSAHLLVPGWTNTSIVLKSMKRGNPAAFDLEKVPFHEAKPHAGAWTCEQVVEYLLEWLAKGKFYIICPDNEVDIPTDLLRMEWAAHDVIEAREPLSRWHPDYTDAFSAFLESEMPRAKAIAEARGQVASAAADPPIGDDQKMADAS